ncbi:MAG: hypothetical protein ACFB6R_07830 [Alphaproteobacteria bacterium]
MGDDQFSNSSSGRGPSGNNPQQPKGRLDAVRTAANRLGDAAMHVGPFLNGLQHGSSRLCLFLTGEDSLGWFQSASGQAKEFEQRMKVQKALDKIEKEGFYTLGGVVSLMREHYTKEADAAFDTWKRAKQGTDAEKEAKAAYREMLWDVERRLKGRSVTHQLRRLMDAKQGDRLYRAPRGRRLQLIHDFMDKTGFMDAPVPVKWIKERPGVLQTMLYAGAGAGSMVYHSVRQAMGQPDPKKDYKDDEVAPFAGAVYQSYVFDNPYFKRGVFVVRPGDLRGPVEVEYFEGWSVELQAENYRSNFAGSGPAVRQRYEEYYRGYLLDQGYDSYVLLFGPQDPGLKVSDPYNARIAIGGLQKLMNGAGRTWDRTKETIADFLKGLPEDYVLKTLTDYLEVCDVELERAKKRHASDVRRHLEGEARTTGTELAVVDRYYDARTQFEAELRTDFTGRAARSSVFEDPDLKNHSLYEYLSSVKGSGSPDDRGGNDPYADEAKALRDALWKMFEVDTGEQQGPVGSARRVRTLYLEGANRNALTPNILKGSVMAFDNTGRSDMLREGTIMYRMDMPSENPVDVASMTIMARNRAERFDMRAPDLGRERLGLFEPKYREIFLSLGYDVAPRSEEEKPYRVDPLVSNTATDAEEMEVVLEP